MPPSMLVLASVSSARAWKISLVAALRSLLRSMLPRPSSPMMRWFSRAVPTAAAAKAAKTTTNRATMPVRTVLMRQGVRKMCGMGDSKTRRRGAVRAIVAHEVGHFVTLDAIAGQARPRSSGSGQAAVWRHPARHVAARHEVP